MQAIEIVKPGGKEPFPKAVVCSAYYINTSGEESITAAQFLLKTKKSVRALLAVKLVLTNTTYLWICCL